MSEPNLDRATQRRPHGAPASGVFSEFDLHGELAQLGREKPWANGHAAKTLLKYDSLRVVLMALEANARVLEHKTDGQISIQALSGHLRVHASGRTFDLRTGGLVALDHALPHSVEAVEDSAFLLTIAWPGHDATVTRQP